jgi:lipoprotein NlpI
MLGLDSRSLEARNNLGVLLYDKGDYRGAKQEFSLVLENDPSSSSARFNMARTLAAMRPRAPRQCRFRRPCPP